jgi:ribosomal protein S18 acetylase RimI-like enzyme
MRIRQYHPGDESEIAVVHNSAFRSSIESLPEIYQCREVTPGEVLDWFQENVVIWVVEEGQRIVGYAQFRIEMEHGKRDIPVLQFMPAKIWDLEQSNIAVLPEFQRNGIGAKLLRAIIDKYKSKIEFVTAQTFSDNQPAEKLFESNGFTMRDVFYHSDFSDVRPLANSSVYAIRELENLKAPSNLNRDIIVRRATIEDAAATAELQRLNVFWCDECKSIEWNRGYISGKYGYTVFVVEVEGKVVGAIDYSKDGRVGISGVLPSMRKKGIGSAMFYSFLQAMKKDGYKFAFIDSGLTQVDAIKMYERFGFTIQRRQNAWVKSMT